MRPGLVRHKGGPVVTLPEGTLPPDPFALYRAFEQRQREPRTVHFVTWNVVEDFQPPKHEKPKKARRPRSSLAASIWPTGECKK